MPFVLLLQPVIGGEDEIELAAYFKIESIGKLVTYDCPAGAHIERACLDIIAYFF